MRELTYNEALEVGGALNFTSSITLSTLNSVGDLSAVVRMASLAFGAGYALGTYLNNKFDLSTKIVDGLIG